MERLIFHVDVNSAFLSWEAAKRVKEGLPDLREIPSCIGGDPKLRRSIVVAKSIPAKKYGVTTKKHLFYYTFRLYLSRFPPFLRARIGPRYCPVYEPLHCATSSGVPQTTSRPPPSPPSGPRSRI